jgi:hypothetical protein
MSGRPTAALSAATTLLDRFGRRYTEPFNFQLSDRHAFSSSIGEATRNQAARVAVL